MRMVLISDFVNRNRIVIILPTIEPRDARPRIIDFRLECGVIEEGGVALEPEKITAESWNISNS